MNFIPALIHRRIGQLLLLVLALAMAGYLLAFTHQLVDHLKQEEQRRIALWAEASTLLGAEEPASEASLSLALSLVQQNHQIPVILTDTLGDILLHRNLSPRWEKRSGEPIRKQLARMQAEGNRLTIQLGSGHCQYLYFDESYTIQKLRMFPVIQMGLVALFILLAYVVFNNSRKAEQNQVWIGMAKETAHQLGTPTSSIMGWVNLLKGQKLPVYWIEEMEKDLDRLQNVADRFSKIGSRPDLQPMLLYPVVENLVQYLSGRISGKAHLQIFRRSEMDLMVAMNPVLMEWVLETLCKNALDAISGEGRIQVFLHSEKKYAIIDVADNGKGLKRRMFKQIFRAGYTTKPRGWGLGLTLSKRIVYDYHKGKIFVKESEPGKGTTIRVMLPLIRT